MASCTGAASPIPIYLGYERRYAKLMMDAHRRFWTRSREGTPIPDSHVVGCDLYYLQKTHLPKLSKKFFLTFSQKGLNKYPPKQTIYNGSEKIFSTQIVRGHSDVRYLGVYDEIPLPYNAIPIAAPLAVVGGDSNRRLGLQCDSDCQFTVGCNPYIPKNL